MNDTNIDDSDKTSILKETASIETNSTNKLEKREKRYKKNRATLYEKPDTEEKL